MVLNLLDGVTWCYSYSHDYDIRTDQVRVYFATSAAEVPVNFLSKAKMLLVKVSTRQCI